jgi:hypothetical protein
VFKKQKGEKKFEIIPPSPEYMSERNLLHDRNNQERRDISKNKPIITIQTWPFPLFPITSTEQYSNEDKEYFLIERKKRDSHFMGHKNRQKNMEWQQYEKNSHGPIEP